MSFLSDLFEGNWSNLGTDITHAPESAVTDYRSEWVPAAAIGGALLTGGLLAPELLGGAALGEAAGAGSAEAGLAAADTAFGAFDPALYSANLAATEIAPTGVDLGTAAATGGASDLLGAGASGLDLTATAADPALSASIVDPATGLSATPLDPSLSATVIDPTTGAPVSGGWGQFAPDITAQDFAPSYGADLTVDTGTTGPYSTAGSYLTADEQASLVGQYAPGTSTAAAPAGAAPAGAGGDYASTLSQLGGAGGTGVGTATPAANAGLFGQGGVLGTGLSGWQAAGLGLAAAPLALALLRGEPSIPPQATQAQANANTLSAFGAQQLAAGQSGQLNAGQQAMIDQLGQNELNNYRQTLYNMGVKDPNRDTRYAQMQAKVEQDKFVLTQSLLQQDIQNGLAALGSASGTLTQVAQMQMNADQQFTNNLVNATTALGRVAGSGMMNPNFAGGGRTTTTTTTVQAA